MSALVAIQYRTTFQGALDQSGLRALTENPAIRILFGTPLALDDAGGFTVWRTGMPVLVLASVWILLTGTRMTRGEEDTGRFDLLLAGRLSMAGLVARSVMVIGGASMVIGVAVGAALVAAGTHTTGAGVYGGAIFALTLTVGSGAVLASQIMPTRSAAVGVSVGFLGLALLMRMLADGVPELAWTAWTTPFGLAARAAPYAHNRIGPLLVMLCLAVAFGVAALWTARHRDAGRGLIRVATSRAPQTMLLGSLTGFAIRRAIRPTAGWAIGIATYFVVFGALIASILEFFGTNRRFAELAAAAGFGGLDSAAGLAAALFGLLAVPTSLYAATRLAALATDERDRRWTPVLATDIPRIHLAGREIAVTTACMLLLHLTAGLAIWTGAAITGAPLTIGHALSGALYSASVAWLAVGAATLAVGWLPAAVGLIGALPVAGGFLFYVLADSAGAPAWVAGMSPFAHLAPVPDAAPNWAATTAFFLTGVGLVAAGITRYAHRDFTT
ncbi:polyketide antibiotic transporter [Mycolicibacterium tusciae]|uniref:polyketide antibiotic transporter n=1 Tax=Mycolicibacterium tusciae TaxID=75922 RepID=UPI001EF8B982|nr:polyketide antibiotic transporter [Mycolicibacterium tusciae]